ncbi:hypothetical protein L2W42_35165 (plasmid) [Rhizobium gallicum]|nr:hypothetical protein [Rhizobium gallicum]ULJ75445.1 hypothetical protein L2W42_35165 [Rhizobium gallicum]
MRGARDILRARQEVGIRLIQIAQGLLLGRHMHGGNPVERGPQCGQFPRLGDGVQAVPGLPPVMPPPVPALLQRQIIDQPHNPRELPQQDFLFGGRSELVAESAVDHVTILSIAPRSATGDRTGRHVVYMLHVHLAGLCHEIPP